MTERCLANTLTTTAPTPPPDEALVGVVTDRDIKRALDPDLGLPPKDELFVRDRFIYCRAG